jgi:hypothetical protein
MNTKHLHLRVEALALSSQMALIAHLGTQIRHLGIQICASASSTANNEHD